MPIEVMTLTNPIALTMPEVRAQLDKWTAHQMWIDELSTRMYAGGAAIIVGTTNDMVLEGAAIVTLPMNMGESLPWVIYFYNDGGHALTEKMLENMVAFIRGAGYTSYMALNQSGRADKDWLKVFEKAGNPKFIGSSYLFDLTESNSDERNSVGRGGARNRAKPVRRQKSADAAEHFDTGRYDKTGVQSARAGRVRRPKRAYRRRTK